MVLQKNDRFICITKNYLKDGEYNVWPEESDSIEAKATLEELEKLGLTHFVEIPQEHLPDGYYCARIYTKKEISEEEEAVEWYNVAQAYEYRLFGGFEDSSDVITKVRGRDITTDYAEISYLGPPLLIVK